MGAERPLDGRPSTSFGQVQPFGCAQHDHRPGGPRPAPVAPGRRLDAGDVVEGLVECGRELLVDIGRLVAFDEDRAVTVSQEQAGQLVVADPGQHCRVGDLVTVQMQDRQHGAVAHGIEKFVGVPACRQRPRLRLAITDDARNDQVGIVEHGAVGVHEGVAELATFVDGSRRLRRDVARNPPGKGELAEELPESLGVLPMWG